MIIQPKNFSINNIIKIKPQAFKGDSNRYNLKTDVFEKTASDKTPKKINPTRDYTVKSGSNAHAFKKFVEFAQDNDFTAKLPEIITEENFIGEGFEGKTYFVPMCSDYIVKVLKKDETVEPVEDNPVINETPNPLPGLNIGQEIATVDIKSENGQSKRFHVLQRQSGKPVGMSYNEANNIGKIYVPKRLKEQIAHLEKLSEAPQKTYDKLIDDVLLVKQAGYNFDCNSSDNFFFDDEAQEIKFIDLGKPDNNSENESNQFEGVLSALLNVRLISNCNRFPGCAEREKETAAELSETIVDKYTTAMKNKNVKFADNSATDILISSGYLCADIAGSAEDKKEYLRQNNLL